MVAFINNLLEVEMLRNIIDWTIHRLILMVFDKPLEPPTNSDKELVEELKAVFRELPHVNTTNCAPSEKEWSDNMNRLREWVLNDDPRDFLRCDVISKSMFVRYSLYIYKELNLKNLTYNLGKNKATLSRHTRDLIKLGLIKSYSKEDEVQPGNIKRKYYRLSDNFKALLKKKAQISLFAYVPFMKEFIANKQEYTGSDFTQTTSFTILPESLYTVRLSYKFNRGKKVNKINREKETEEEGQGGLF